MGRLRKKGERSDVILDEIDLMMLKTLIQSPKDILIMQLGKMLNLTHSSLKRHLVWLEELKLIARIPIAQTRKVILKPTPEGRTIFKILNSNIHKDSYKY